jgi:hypothetical protein
VRIVVLFVQRILGGCNVASVEAAHSATARAGNVPLIRVSAAEIISAIVVDPRKAACVSLERKGVFHCGERYAMDIVNGRELVVASKLNATKIY